MSQVNALYSRASLLTLIKVLAIVYQQLFACFYLAPRPKHHLDLSFVGAVFHVDVAICRAMVCKSH